LTERLIGYARNPRRNDPAIDRMKASIREFGFAVPVLATRDFTVVDGHLRLKAAKALGMSEVPVVWCDGWTEAQVRAFRLVANRSVDWAEWDVELLKLEMLDLSNLGYDLNLTGFDPKEIAALQIAVGTGHTDEDDIPETPVEPVSKPGDLWRLGVHKLLCGDATLEADVSHLLAGVEPMLMVTDPPYGVNYDPVWRNRAARKGTIAFAVRREGRVANDNRIDWREAYMLFPGDIIYLWHASLYGCAVQQSLDACGFEARSQIVWAKSHFAISRGHYHWQHETCFYLIRKRANSHWNGGRSQTTLWRIETKAAEESKNNHGAAKPVECMRRPILNHLDSGQSVYDPFVGSGTTIIAAETTGRVAYAIDIDPAYVDVAVKRWQDFTGRQAVLDSTKQTFDSLVRGGTRREER